MEDRVNHSNESHLKGKLVLLGGRGSTEHSSQVLHGGVTGWVALREHTEKATHKRQVATTQDLWAESVPSSWEVPWHFLHSSLPVAQSPSPEMRVSCLSKYHVSDSQTQGLLAYFCSFRAWDRSRQVGSQEVRQVDRGIQTDRLPSSWRNSHRGRQARPLGCLPLPLRAPSLLPPLPLTPPGLVHRFISKSSCNPAIGFVITGSNVHGMNILTN
jgi:hypothetical protein